MKPEHLMTRLRKLLSENERVQLSLAVLLLGAIPLYIYALSIDQIPDFSLVDLTGILVASFLTEVLLGTLMVGYLLSAGFAARKVMDFFYPSSDSATVDAKDAPASLIRDTREYLIRGRFIIGVTMFDVLIWFGAAVKPFNMWLAPQHPGLATCVYNVALVTCVLLVLIDWRRGWRPAKYILFAVLCGATAFLGVLTAAYLGGYVAEVPLAAHAATEHRYTWLSAFASSMLHDRLILTASIGALFVAVSLSALAFATRNRRSVVRSGGTPPTLFRNPAHRLVVAKLLAAAAFTFFTGLSALFFMVVVEASTVSKQTMIALTGAMYLFVLNWGSFSERDRKQRVFPGLVTFALVFIVLPLQSGNAAMFPKMVVTPLGLGNLRANSIALSSLECSALLPYGVDCDAKKDSSIGLTNVNILNRLGSPVLIELQVRRSPESATGTTHAGPTGQAFGVAGSPPARTERVTLVLPPSPKDDATRKLTAKLYPCDGLLLDRLRAIDAGKADALACVKLSIPKEYVLGNTTNGAATYSGDFSQYVRVLASASPETHEAKHGQ
jgi:hypothetical protein